MAHAIDNNNLVLKIDVVLIQFTIKSIEFFKSYSPASA